MTILSYLITFLLVVTSLINQTNLQSNNNNNLSKQRFRFPTLPPRAQRLIDDKKDPQDPDSFLEWLIGSGKLDDYEIYQSYDGWFNNKNKPSSGSTGSSLNRLLPARYSDGKGEPVSYPNPFDLSSLLTPTNNQDQATNQLGKNAFLVSFGEHVTNEIVDTRIASSCPPEYIKIPIPEYHEFYLSLGHSYMPFLRSKYLPGSGRTSDNPRQMINEATPYIDGGTIYGRSKVISDQLRSFKGGKLRSEENSNFPRKNHNGLPVENEPIYANNSHHVESIKRFLATGDFHANENPFLLAINIMWFRWHNLIAKKLQQKNENWDDEKIFNEARRWVIATQQQIIINEWLPIWTGQNLADYSGYKQSVDPAISHVFSGAAMRYGHILVPPNIKLWFDSCESSQKTDQRFGPNQRRPNLSSNSNNRKIVRLCNSYFDSSALTNSNHDLRAFLMSLTITSARPDGSTIAKDLQTRTYGPLDFTRRDLAAVNIERGRDFGLPDYLSTRIAFNLTSYSDFPTIIKNLWNYSSIEQQNLLQSMNEYYFGVDNIDLWFGGLMESNVNGIGPIFRSIINEQFERVRDSDYFWFQNKRNGLFNDEQISKLESLTIRDILIMTLNLTDKSIQEKPFLLPNDQNNYPASCGPKDLKSFPCKQGNCYASTVSDDLADQISSCPRPQTYDYLKGSEWPLLITIGSFILYVLTWVAILWLLISIRKLSDESTRMQSKKAKMSAAPHDENTIIAFEYEGDSDNLKPILITFELEAKRIAIKGLGKGQKLIRRINFKGLQTVKLQISVNPNQPLVLVKFPSEHDLIVTFDSEEEQNSFVKHLESFLALIGVGRERQEMDSNRILKTAYSKIQRQKHLESFFRAVFAHAFDIKPLKSKVDLKIAKNILQTELTEYEFAEALAMRPDSLFVKQMFALVDKDENGYISFREFLDMMIIFAKGSSDQKAKLMFDMYDLDGTGSLSKSEFSTMIRSMLELANQSIEPEQIEQLINSMYQSAGFHTKSELTLNDFLKFLGDYKDEFGYVELNLEVGDLKTEIDSKQNKRLSAIMRARDKVSRAYSIYDNKQTIQQGSSDQAIFIETSQPIDQHGILARLSRFIDEHKWHIFWFLAFLVITVYLFLDSFIYHLYFNEDRGLRQILGYGVALSRGSASSIMFIFSLILLTMSRNLITILRETFLHKFIPFDASVSFHKIVAISGLIFVVIHVIGHTSNFYHILTQRPIDLSCLFPGTHSRSNELPKFADWFLGSISGITGLSLLGLITIIYIFSMPISRRYVFTAFWTTHNLYPLFYLLMFLHGLGQLIQPPGLPNFLIIPLILFKIDKLLSISRKKAEIRVIKAIHYPSDVTMLCFAKPENFEYKSGQWVRIASVDLNPNEFHPFTLASAPHEEYLQLFIRAVGPFTCNIRKIYDPNGLRMSPMYPNLRLDGPYGETHQDWFRYPVSVLVGGGIGVTPFASILKDVAFRASINRMTTCHKVYFLWVTRTQKHFEWLVDILRDLEEKDIANLVCVHIFITQFYDKFDLRTMMLYVCERHFQRVSNRSLFTGLKAKTQFGRPNFHQFFTSLQRLHPKVSRIGVFSCGPPPMTNSVGSACEHLNRQSGALFIHHSENF